MKKLALLILLFFLSCDKNELDRPNILFIMSDDHTSQAWGIYGGILQDYVKNDGIKRLEKSGVVLENLFCTNSICVPSCLLYTSPSPRDGLLSRMPSSA